MKRKQFTEEKIISILKENEAGASVPNLSRRHGVSEQSIYRWKAKYGGMEVSDAKRLRALEVFGRRNGQGSWLHAASRNRKVSGSIPPFSCNSSALV